MQEFAYLESLMFKGSERGVTRRMFEEKYQSVE